MNSGVWIFVFNVRSIACYAADLKAKKMPDKNIEHTKGMTQKLKY